MPHVKQYTGLAVSLVVSIVLVWSVVEYYGSASAEQSLSIVSPRVVEAVAPYDAASAVSQSVVAAELIHPWNVNQQQCMADHGVGNDSAVERPALDPAVLIRDNPNRFPHIESLEEDGFLNQLMRADATSENESPPGESREVLHPDFENAVTAFHRDAELEGVRDGYELFFSLAIQWQEILDDIDGSDEVQLLRQEMAACLQADGVPAEVASHENRFLGYVDSLIFEQSGSPDESARIYREYGQMYVRCGEPMFVRRQSLYLEQRDRFLDANTRAIAQLDQYLQS